MVGGLRENRFQKEKKFFFLTKPLLNSPKNKRHAQVTTEEIDTVWSTSFVLVITGLCASSGVMHQASVFLQPQGNSLSPCSHSLGKL